MGRKHTNTWGQRRVLNANATFRLVDLVLPKPQDVTLYIQPLYFTWDYVTPPAAGYNQYSVYAGIAGGSVPLLAPDVTQGLSLLGAGALVNLRTTARGAVFHVAAQTVYLEAKNVLAVPAVFGAYAALGRPSESQYPVSFFNLGAAPAAQVVVAPPFATHVEIHGNSAAQIAACTIEELNDQANVLRSDTAAAYASKQALCRDTAAIRINAGAGALAAGHVDWTILQ